MRADHRMFSGRVLLAQLGPLRLVDHSEDAREVVDRGAAVELFLDRLGEIVVRGFHVGEQRVAADRRDLHRAEHRPERRLLAPRDVAVPGVLAALPLVVRDEDHHFRVAGLGRHERMHFEVTELAEERDVLVGGDVLLAEEQHLVVEPGLLQLRKGAGVAEVAEIDAVHLGPDRRCERLHIDRHLFVAPVVLA